MSKKQFTDEQVQILNQNKYVVNATENYINYSEEFKELFLMEYTNGMPPREIFLKYGFDLHIIDGKRRDNFVQRVKKYSKRPEGFCDTRKYNEGRPSTKELTADELNKQLQHKIDILKQENDFLKRVRSLNRKQLLKQSKVKL